MLADRGEQNHEIRGQVLGARDGARQNRPAVAVEYGDHVDVAAAQVVDLPVFEIAHEGLQKRVDFDIAPDARLSAPTPQLGRPALDARVPVVDTPRGVPGEVAGLSGTPRSVGHVFREELGRRMPR